MAEFVTMYHPDLSKKQTIQVPARSVAHRAACGWVEVKEEPAKRTAAPKPETGKPSEGNA